MCVLPHCEYMSPLIVVYQLQMKAPTPHCIPCPSEVSGYLLVKLVTRLLTGSPS